MESVMNRKIKFWNKVANKYAKSPVADQASYEKKLQITQNYLQPEMEVLEIGCGTGTTALIHAPFVQRIHALDFSETMIEICREKAESLSIENVFFECKDIESLSKEKNHYDVVMAHSVLHLVDDKQSTIDNAYDLLKPGGIFVSSTVCLTGFYVVLKSFWPVMYWLGIFPSLRFFSSQALIDAHISSGFTIDYQWQASSNSLFLIAKKNKPPQNILQ
jgi:ubiquinone/menaquinone biosynthesis C-methylase UbiE